MWRKDRKGLEGLWLIISHIKASERWIANMTRGFLSLSLIILLIKALKQSFVMRKLVVLQLLDSPSFLNKSIQLTLTRNENKIPSIAVSEILLFTNLNIV